MGTIYNFRKLQPNGLIPHATEITPWTSMGDAVAVSHRHHLQRLWQRIAPRITGKASDYLSGRTHTTLHHVRLASQLMLLLLLWLNDQRSSAGHVPHLRTACSSVGQQDVIIIIIIIRLVSRCRHLHPLLISKPAALC